MSANPSLAVVLATPSLFHAEDAADPRFYILATLGSGVLRFEVVSRLASGERGSVSGKELFAALMSHFGPRVKIIEGNWSKSSGLTTNIDQLNKATVAGLSLQDAASFTWTGLCASKFGYNIVTVTRAVPPDSPGNYDTVHVEFSR